MNWLPLRNALPNGITLVNVFCGCCALGAVLYGQYIAAFWLLFAAGWADFLDGMVARWLGIHSPMGKELDSLADMVSFGVVPGAIAFRLLSSHFAEGAAGFHWAASPAFLIPIFSALRLAKFNLDTRQSEGFLGLATPANTMFFVGLMLVFHGDIWGLGWLVAHPAFLYPIVGLSAYLLVSEIPMFSFKFKKLSWAGNEWRFGFIIVALNLMVILRGASFAIIILLYIFASILQNTLNPQQR